MAKTKKLLGVLLAAVMLLGMLPLTVFGAGIVAQGECGENGNNVKWVLTDDGTLTISGSGKMESNEKWNDSPWYSIREKINTVEIKQGVTSIGLDAFFNCERITNITIPDSVTSIEDAAFVGCSELESIVIPASVTSIGSVNPIWDCPKLSSISVDKRNPIYHSSGNCLIETASKTLIAGCKSSVIPSDGSVTSIWQLAFAECTGLTNIVLPDSVTSIGAYAFTECTGLTNIVLPDSVTSIGCAAFSGCMGLTNITISDSVTNIESIAFDKCEKLTDVYYTGSEADWKKIKIEVGNDCLLNAKIHYNSTPAKPVAAGFGDPDGDGKITSADARLALRGSVGLENYAVGSVQFAACDVDKDNKITAADARFILRVSVGLEKI